MKTIISLLIPFLFLSLVACQSSTAQSKTVDLTAKDFDQKIKALPDETIIDVRTPEEYADGHLIQSVNMDWNGDYFNQEIAKLDKSKPVFLYCYGGGRSSDAAKAMIKAGFKNVYNLENGFREWEEAGLPVTKD